MVESDSVDDGWWSPEQLLWEQFQLQEDIEDELDAMVEEDNIIQATIRDSKHNLTLQQRRLIVDNLSAISRINKEAMKQRAKGNGIDVRSKKCGRSGRKSNHYSDDFLQSCPLHLRTTIRSFAGALKLPHVTVYRLLKRGRLRSHTSSCHPRVTKQHKLARMKWVLSHVIPKTLTEKAVFTDIQNVIHIDEKWFYLNPEMRRFYLLPFEDDPYRCCQSKRFRIKVMFIAAIGRPLYDINGTELHDRKYRIFPFIEYVTAKKNSKNRAVGTVETKAIESVTQQVIKKMLIDKIIPAIMDKWPTHLPKDIVVQQDNARPHISDADLEFREAANSNGFNIKLVNQPAQPPDLNILDLCLFRSVQSLQNQDFPKNLDELITRVQDAYDFYDTKKIKFAWLQLQYVMNEILKVKGGNDYKNPHHGKAHLERIGQLLENVEVEDSVVEEAVKWLNERHISVDDNLVYLDEEVHGVEMQVDAD